MRYFKAKSTPEGKGYRVSLNKNKNLGFLNNRDKSWLLNLTNKETKFGKSNYRLCKTMQGRLWKSQNDKKMSMPECLKN
jgi:hypothetical protein